MLKNRICYFIGISAFLLASCGEENTAVSPIDSVASETTSSSIQNAEISSSSLATSTLSSSEQTESSSQTTLSSSLTVEHSSSSVDATSSNSNLSSSGFGPVSFGEMTDERDGQVYKTVKIGTQTWMAENLNYAYPQQDSSLDTASWCYNNEPDSCAKYGRLYTWEAAMDCYTQFGENKSACSLFYHNKERNDDYKPQGACPTNWHIPYENEWTVLIDLVRDSSSALKSTSGWLDDGNGTDIFGFSVLPAGMFDAGDLNRQKKYTFKSGYGVGKITCFWTTTQSTMDFGDISPISDYESAIALCFSNDNPYVLLDDVVQSKFHAFSVRCVKDAETSE